jgi:hypothetical protein
MIQLLPALAAGILWAACAAAGAAPADEPYVENSDISMSLRPHSPDQMAAFYEARGFPRSAVQRLRHACFITVHVENRGRQVVWLELKNWHFLTGKGEIHRLDRSHWDSVWDEIGLPPANRSTFGWTQLPAVRDLQPGEPVGGNVILPVTDGAFTLHADFLTGKDKRAGLISARFEKLRCAEDPAP